MVSQTLNKTLMNDNLRWGQSKQNKTKKELINILLQKFAIHSFFIRILFLGGD